MKLAIKGSPTGQFKVMAGKMLVEPELLVDISKFSAQGSQSKRGKFDVPCINFNLLLLNCQNYANSD